MRIVITSWLEATSRMVSRDLLLGQRVERRGRLVEDEQVRPAQQRPGDRQPLLLAARDLDAALADHRVEPAVGARQQAVAGRLLQHLEALRVGGVRVDEQQVLADRAREELRVLGDEADLRAQLVQVDLRARLCRCRGCARSAAGRGRPAASRASSCPRPTARRRRSSRRARPGTRCRESAGDDAVWCWKLDVLEGQGAQLAQRHGIGRLRLLRHVEDRPGSSRATPRSRGRC